MVRALHPCDMQINREKSRDLKLKRRIIAMKRLRQAFVRFREECAVAAKDLGREDAHEFIKYWIDHAYTGTPFMRGAYRIGPRTIDEVTTGPRGRIMRDQLVGEN